MNNNDKNIWDHHQNANRSHLVKWYPRQTLISKLVLKYLPKWSNILEIGFWDGFLLNKNSLNWFNVIGQDLSQKNIDITKKQWNNKKIEFILWDNSWKFSFDNNSIDAFIASEVLEHMDEKQLKICISEIFRILKKWGYAFITFPAKENLKNNECICPNCSTVFHKWWHKQYWDESKIKDSFSKFNIIKQTEIFNRYTWNSITENFIWYFMYFTRKILNKFINLEGKSYLLILKKND